MNECYKYLLLYIYAKIIHVCYFINQICKI